MASLDLAPICEAAARGVTSVPLLDMGRENTRLADELQQAFASVMASGRFVLGPECEQLEQRFAERCGCSYAVGCASGSDALLLLLMAIGLQPGDEVILPSFTFFATASSAWRLGARPVFADVDATTFNLDPDHVRSLITPRTRAILPVHLFGQCAAMQPISEIASHHGLDVIEDCAQSLDATYRGKPAGGMSLGGAFSFYPTKNLGGCGDGGMITTSDPELADRLRLLRVHGMKPRYLHRSVGINSRLDTIQAAILLTKLPHLTHWTQLRRENAARYERLFVAAGLNEIIGIPRIVPDCESVWNQFTIRVPDGQRDALRAHLAAAHVGTEVYYPLPLHLQPCFADLSDGAGSLPVTEAAAQEVLSLPIFPTLTAAEQQYVVESIGSFFHSN